MRRIKKSPGNRQGGFTLIEIMVALVILAAGFLTVVQLFSGGVRLATASDRYIQGITLANNKFSQLEIKNFEPEETSGEFEEYPGYRWEFESSSFASPVNDPGVGIQLNEVALTVLWNEGEKQQRIRLTSLWPEGGRSRLAPDTVLLGNVASLGNGTGNAAAANAATATSSQGGPRAANATGTGNPVVSPGVGTVPQAPGTSLPKQDPNFQFDVSGMPTKPPPAGTKPPLLGLTGGS